MTDDTLKYLQYNRNLSDLRLKNTSVSGKGFVYLKELTNLIGVEITGGIFNDIGLKYLSEIKFKKPVTISLCDTKITDRGLKYLSKVTLYELSLINTNITDNGLQYLVGQNDVWKIYLNETKVTQKGAEWLMKKLPNADISYGKFQSINIP